MNINLEYYKIFYYVAKYESVTKAAKELCVSQPAVSQALKHLEKMLNISLFNRVHRGMILTGEGKILFSYVASSYENILLGEKKIKEILDLEYGELRIGASDMTLQFYLLPYLEKFHQLYPDIKVNVTNAPTPKTIEQLRKGWIDFGVVSTPFLEEDGLEIMKTKKIKDVFVAGSKFVHLKNKKISFQTLEALPIICLENNTSTRKYIDNILKKNNVTLKPEFELATSDMIVQFAIKNLGIGCVMGEFADPYIESGKLFPLHFQKEIPKRDICVIHDPKIPMSIAARKLKNLLN